jgi:hypothetical protein
MSAGSNKLKIEDVRNYIKSYECQLISKDYISSKDKLTVKFSCGHISKMSFECFKRGQRCSCDKIKRFKNSVEIKTRETLLKVLSMIGYKIISFEDGVCSWDGDFTYECACGNIETRGVREFLRSKVCLKCSNLKTSQRQRGDKGNNWQGGKTEFSIFIQKQLSDWKKKSMKSSNYKCVVTLDRFQDIHHLYPLNNIILKAHKDLKILGHKSVGEYSKKELSSLVKRIMELHDENLGVCLRKDVHQLFHKLYGNKNTTPEDFYEFKDKVISGEIQI